MEKETKTPPSLFSYAGRALDAMCLVLFRGRDSATPAVIGRRAHREVNPFAELHLSSFNLVTRVFDIPCGPRSGIKTASGDFKLLHVLRKGRP